MKRWLLVLALLSPPAIAQECRYDGSQLEMNACAKRDFKVADLAMTQAYGMRMKKQFTKKNQTALVSEQAVWLQRRAARCKLNPGNGSNSIIEYYTCMQSMTEVRTLMLLRR